MPENILAAAAKFTHISNLIEIRGKKKPLSNNAILK